MKFQMQIDQLSYIVTLSFSIFFGMLLLIKFGYFIEQKNILKNSKINNGDFGSIHAALFALLGLIIAFTFTSAYERYDHRRQIIVQEINSIETAYLRIDLLPEKKQVILKEKFLSYIDGRISFYKKLVDKSEAIKELEKRSRLQNEIWNLSIEATSSASEYTARMLLLPALNQMFDISTVRKNAILTHAPAIIIYSLVGLSFTCAFLAGVGMARSSKINWLHSILFCLIVSFFIYLILDIEYPRHGIVQLDKANELLIELQHDMIQKKSLSE